MFVFLVAKTLFIQNYLLQSDDTLYLLHAVLVHSGTDGDGHYIAYINHELAKEEAEEKDKDKKEERVPKSIKEIWPQEIKKTKD